MTGIAGPCQSEISLQHTCFYTILCFLAGTKEPPNIMHWSSCILIASDVSWILFPSTAISFLLQMILQFQYGLVFSTVQHLQMVDLH